MQANIRIRQAVAADIPILRELIEASVRGLQAQDYTLTQLESALKTVYGVDSQLIADGTYFVAETEAGEAEPQTARRSMAATGGQDEKTNCWIRFVMRRKFVRFLSIPHGRGAASAAGFWRLVKPPRGPRDLRVSRWGRR